MKKKALFTTVWWKCTWFFQQVHSHFIHRVSDTNNTHVYFFLSVHAWGNVFSPTIYSLVLNIAIVDQYNTLHVAHTVKACKESRV